MALLPPVPPIGAPDPNNQLSFIVNELVLESTGVRDPYLDALPSNLNQYLHGRSGGPSLEHSTLNKTQPGIHAFVHMAIKNPPVVSIVAACVGDQPDFYLSAPAPGVDYTQPLNPGAVMALISAGTLDDVAVRVDMDCVTEFYQSVFDVQWERARVDQFLRDNVLNTQIDGWQFSLYEWDDIDQKHLLSNPPPQQWFADPTESDVGKMAYLGFDWPMDATLAKRKYPQLTQAIDDAASYEVYLAGNAQNYSHVYTDPVYKRGIVTVRTMWLRNQACPLTPEDAVGRGIVQQVKVPDQQQMLLGSGDDAGGDWNAAAQDPGDQGSGDDAGSSSQVGADLSAGAGPSPPMRDAYIHAETGEEVTPEHGSWPHKYCLRRTMSILNKTVDDAVASTWDMPVLRNVNVPTPRRPYGQGEPERIRSQQDDLNSVHDSTVVHAKRFKSPAIVGDLSIKEQLPEKFKDAYQDPGTLWWADFSTLAPGTQAFQVFNPPPLSQSVLTVKNDLITAMDISSGYANELQGQGADLSGSAIAQRQAAASDTAGFRFLYFNETVWRLSRLMHYSHVTRMTVESLMRINRKYPAHIVAAIRAKAQDAEWDCKVQASADAGRMKAEKDAQTLEWLKAGVIDMETARDLLNLDHSRIEQRINQQQRKQQAQAAVAGAPATAAASPQLTAQPA